MRKNPGRLSQLQKLVILDTGPEQLYDDLANLLAANLDVPISMVNLLDADRDWFKACKGLPLTESPAETSFCEAFFHSQEEVIVVPDTLNDPRFASHPLVTGAPFIRFYIAARLEVNGHTVGTLCGYDMKPHAPHAAAIDNIKILAAAAAEGLKKRVNPVITQAPSQTDKDSAVTRTIYIIDAEPESANALCELLKLSVFNIKIKVFRDWTDNVRSATVNPLDVVVFNLSPNGLAAKITSDKLLEIGSPIAALSIAITSDHAAHYYDKQESPFDHILRMPLDLDAMVRILVDEGFSPENPPHQLA